MRRAELERAAKNLRRVLEKSRISEVLSELMGGPAGRRESPTRPVALEAMRVYFVEAEQFDKVERNLIDILDLNFLDDLAFWAALTGQADHADAASIHQEMFALRFALESLPKVVSLVRPSGLDEVIASQKAEPHPTRAVLAVIVIEDESRFSTPQRLSIMLHSVADLYEACATIEGTGMDRLCVVACDSGSDKSFDFLGAAKVIECVRDIILSLWDRVVFFRERQVSNRIELVAQSLPVFDRIADLERAEKIGPEQAELLRRQISGGCTRFIESGSMIPEVSKAARFEPRLLLAPEPKLLVAGTGASTEAEPEVHRPSVVGDEELSALSPDEKATLRELLRKATRHDGPPGHAV